MKKTMLVILILALLASVPLFGLAETTQTPDTNPAPTQSFGQQRGRRRVWQPEAPAGGFVDENQDGVCDNCGQIPGQNPQAPGFADENKDGVCDRFGTEAQRLNRRHGMGQGRTQQLKRGRGGMAQTQNRTNLQEKNFTDANQDGICDLFQNRTRQQQPGGRGRFRR